MARSQRHKVIIQNTDTSGKGLSEKQPAPRYINQFANSQAFSVPTGPAGGPLQGSSLAGFPPTLIPLPGLEDARSAELQASGDFSAPGQFDLTGNPIYTSLPETNVPGPGPEPGPGPDPGPNPEPGEEPTLNSINPSQARIGSADVEMHVIGNKFTDTSLIYFNGGAEETTFISDGELTTIVKPSTATTPGDYPVWVQQGTFQTAEQKTFTFLPETEEIVGEERTLPLGPFTLTLVEDHQDGIAITPDGVVDIRVGDTLLIEATGNTQINGSYQVLSIDPVVVDNPTELLTPIEMRGRVTITG